MRVAGGMALFAAAMLVTSAAQAQTDDDWLGADKALHFSVSAGLAGGGYALGAVFWHDYAPRLLLGAGISLTAGVIKELVDLAGPGDASWRDMAWNLMGIATGLLVAWLIDVAIRGLPPAPSTDVAAIGPPRVAF
ncbi:MAG: hypothetical protein DRJ42_04550 [Deltaproteobacteria bacterium]|nr:MAG: hypothetical protein DRJ42_04550 [Deltaproteobacteria bacterium]